jgi:histone H3/H4
MQSTTTHSECEGVTKPAMVRISRRAGIKSVSEDCFPIIRKVIHTKVDDIVRTALLVNSEHQTKTLMADDVYGALRMMGHKVARSTDLVGVK